VPLVRKYQKIKLILDAVDRPISVGLGAH
jgi:hypothetical protein